MGDGVFDKSYILFLLVSIGAGLVADENTAVWSSLASGGKNKIMHSGLAVSFFPAFIALVVIFLFNEYKTAQLPTLNEEMLMNGAEYCLVTDLR